MPSKMCELMKEPMGKRKKLNERTVSAIFGGVAVDLHSEFPFKMDASLRDF